MDDTKDNSFNSSEKNDNKKKTGLSGLFGAKKLEN